MFEKLAKLKIFKFTTIFVSLFENRDSLGDKHFINFLQSSLISQTLSIPLCS